MATNTLVTRALYLATHFDREPELVHGEIVERPVPTRIHGRTQQRLAVLLDRAGYCCTDVRVRLTEDTYRVPDVMVYEGAGPEEQIPVSPPMLIVEISSPDDRFLELLKKCEEYRVWGVANIWIVEPELKKLHVYTDGLHLVSQFELAGHNFTITPADLFA
jgi:Uma2 family endonuclease